MMIYDDISGVWFLNASYFVSGCYFHWGCAEEDAPAEDGARRLHGAFAGDPGGAGVASLGHGGSAAQLVAQDGGEGGNAEGMGYEAVDIVDLADIWYH